MDPELLSILAAVVESGGFSRAAQAVHLTQSAVSQAVARLEAQAGGPVLVRARPPRPTPLGARLLRHARETAAREALLRRDLEDIRRGGHGVLVLGASQALAQDPLPDLVRRFLARHPAAGLHLETRPSREIVRAVAEGRLELGLGPFQKSMVGLVTHARGAQRMALRVRRASPAHRALRASGAAALLDVPLVTSQLDAPGARRGGGQLRERFRTVWEVHSLELRLTLVRDGLAVGYLPDPVVERAGLARTLVAVDWLDFGVIERRYGLFHAEGRELSPPAAAFLAIARERT